MAWVTVSSYPDATSAHLARQSLEQSGLRARLADEHTASIDPLLGGAIGGVKLLVLEADAPRARALLESPELEDEEPAVDEPSCPACGSPYLRPIRPRTLRALARAMAAAARAGEPMRWRCQRCDSEFGEAGGVARRPYRGAALRAGEPSFRLARGRAPQGALLGLGLGALALSAGYAPLLLLLPLAGALLGNGLVHRVCSRPSCRGPLRDTDERCPHCDAPLAGSITEAREHWIRRNAWKRGAERADD